MFVPKYYIMNPNDETDIYAKNLKNGMEVLIESPEEKINEDSALAGRVQKYAAMIMNRWCAVTSVEFNHGGEEVHFIGVYEDGTKFSRACDKWTGWIVKLDSYSRVRTEMDLQTTIVRLISEAMDHHTDDERLNLTIAEGTADRIRAIKPWGGYDIEKPLVKDSVEMERQVYELLEQCSDTPAGQVDDLRRLTNAIVCLFVQ